MPLKRHTGNGQRPQADSVRQRHPAEDCGRYQFLYALQGFAFWRALREHVHSGAVGLDDWAATVGITDEWLIDAIRQTLKTWKRRPRSPQAHCVDGYIWFSYKTPLSGPLPAFRPKLENPAPMYHGYQNMGELIATNSIPETLADMKECGFKAEGAEDFEKRMLSQFQRQLTAYIKSQRAGDWDQKQHRDRDALWTAMVFAGRLFGITDFAPANLARAWPGMERYDEPKSTIEKAVRRFSRDIGLTMPRLKTWRRPMYPGQKLEISLCP